MHRIEFGGRACVDMDTSRRSREKVLDELRAGISGCAEDSIGRGGRPIFRSLHGRVTHGEIHKGIEKEKRLFWAWRTSGFFPAADSPLLIGDLSDMVKSKHNLGGQCYLNSSTVLEREIQWHREMGAFTILKSGSVLR